MRLGATIVTTTPTTSQVHRLLLIFCWGRTWFEANRWGCCSSSECKQQLRATVLHRAICTWNVGAGYTIQCDNVHTLSNHIIHRHLLLLTNYHWPSFTITYHSPLSRVISAIGWFECTFIEPWCTQLIPALLVSHSSLQMNEPVVWWAYEAARLKGKL